ncbi:MAG: hypothetical protein JKY01_07260 [Pseudomonadales bacterium]|nr:hypothetical protein [Pseudomonadales bacterium]
MPDQSKTLKSSVLLYLLVMFFLCLGQSAYAITVIEKSLTQLLEQSDDVIYGLVTDIHAEYGEGEASQQIYTYIKFSEVQRIKTPEENNQNEFLLRIAGGRVGYRAQVIPGAPTFQRGERYVLFVKGNNKLAFPLVGVNQGVFRVTYDEIKKGYRVIFHKRSKKVLEQFRTYRSMESLDNGASFISLGEFIDVLDSRWQKLSADQRQNR